MFRNIDYIEITYRLMRKDYDHLAKRPVPISEEQQCMSHDKIKDMLKTKVRRFGEEQIRKKLQLGRH